MLSSCAISCWNIAIQNHIKYSVDNITWLKQHVQSMCKLSCKLEETSVFNSHVCIRETVSATLCDHCYPFEKGDNVLKMSVSVRPSVCPLRVFLPQFSSHTDETIYNTYHGKSWVWFIARLVSLYPSEFWHDRPLNMTQNNMFQSFERHKLKIFWPRFRQFVS